MLKSTLVGLTLHAFLAGLFLVQSIVSFEGGNVWLIINVLFLLINSGAATFHFQTIAKVLKVLDK